MRDRGGAAEVRRQVIAVVAGWLGEKLPRGARTAAARRLGVCVRTLRNHEKRLTEGRALPRLGRPRLPEHERRRVRAHVVEQRDLQGRRAGWRPILEGIRRKEETVSVMLVQECLGQEKAAERRREREVRERERVSVEVLCRDAIWGEDSAHLGRIEGETVEGEIIRDRGTLATVACSAGPAVTEDDVIALLEQGREERGTLPLALQRDNGGAYRGGKLARYLAKNRVVVLRSRPRTPTDNGATERAVRDVKGESGLGRGVELASVEEAQARLEAAREVLDGGLLRGSRGYRTARELDGERPGWYPRVDRETFYAECCAAIGRAVLGASGARAARVAEREAIHVTLERFGLIRRTRGGKSLDAPARPKRVAATRQDAPGSTIEGVAGPVGSPLDGSGVDPLDAEAVAVAETIGGPIGSGSP